MKVLLDHNVPYDLRLHLPGHLVVTADEMGWSVLENGELLKAAEKDAFEVFVTADQSIFYQQNNEKRSIALVVLGTNNWNQIARETSLVAHAVDCATPASFATIRFESRKRRT